MATLSSSLRQMQGRRQQPLYPSLDLHYFTREQAIRRVKAFLDRQTDAELVVLNVGSGRHSPKVRDAILVLLEQRQLHFSMEDQNRNPVFTVYINSGSTVKKRRPDRDSMRKSLSCSALDIPRDEDELLAEALGLTLQELQDMRLAEIQEEESLQQALEASRQEEEREHQRPQHRRRSLSCPDLSAFYDDSEGEESPQNTASVEHTSKSEPPTENKSSIPPCASLPCIAPKYYGNENRPNTASVYASVEHSLKLVPPPNLKSSIPPSGSFPMIATKYYGNENPQNTVSIESPEPPPPPKRRPSLPQVSSMQFPCLTTHYYGSNNHLTATAPEDHLHATAPEVEERPPRRSSSLSALDIGGLNENEVLALEIQRALEAEFRAIHLAGRT